MVLRLGKRTRMSNEWDPPVWPMSGTERDLRMLTCGSSHEEQKEKQEQQQDEVKSQAGQSLLV